MSGPLGNDQFYENLFKYMNQNTQYSDLPTLSFAPHESEKRGHDEVEVTMEEADGKRRESSIAQNVDSSDEAESKPKKKPGRKMMMEEPVNKRKAQNRAAQRAFRERKEAHLKGLENRVTELEKLTQTKDEENQALKDQVQALQAELNAVRGGNFNFDFNVNSVQNSNVQNQIVPLRNPFQQPTETTQQNGQQPSPSPSSITDSSFFRSGQSSLATSPENDANKHATPNIDIPFDLFSTTPAGPINRNNSNQSTPLFSSDIFSASPASSNTFSAMPPPPLFGQPQQQTTSPILETFASTLASLTQGQSPQSLSNGFGTTMPSTGSTSPLNPFTPASLFDMNDPLFNFSTWRDNSVSSEPDNGYDIYDTMFSSMFPGSFNFADTPNLSDFTNDSPMTLQSETDGKKMCPELWEKVQNNPQLNDIDIDQLCAEMRSKAKCSNSGPVFSSRDVDETFARFV